LVFLVLNKIIFTNYLVSLATRKESKNSSSFIFVTGLIGKEYKKTEYLEGRKDIFHRRQKKREASAAYIGQTVQSSQFFS
jgi:cyclophilin family peptidyl-prolyl cis-trans isomerase